MPGSGQEQHLPNEKWKAPTREAYAYAGAQREGVLGRAWNIAYILPTTIPEMQLRQPADEVQSPVPVEATPAVTPPSVEGLQHTTGITAEDEREIDEREATIAQGLGTVTVQSDQEVIPPAAQNVNMNAMADRVRAEFDQIYGETEAA
jgi:hypothetical protein